MKSKVIDCTKCNKFYIQLNCICKGTGQVKQGKIPIKQNKVNNGKVESSSIVNKTILVSKYNKEFVRYLKSYIAVEKGPEGYFYNVDISPIRPNFDEEVKKQVTDLNEMMRKLRLLYPSVLGTR